MSQTGAFVLSLYQFVSSSPFPRRRHCRVSYDEAIAFVAYCCNNVFSNFLFYSSLAYVYVLRRINDGRDKYLLVQFACT